MKQKGSLLIEVIIAASLIGIVLVSIITMTGNAQQIAQTGLDRTRAAFLLEEGAEIIILHAQEWSSIQALTDQTTYAFSWNSTWNIIPGTESIGEFTRFFICSTVIRDGTGAIAQNGVVDPNTRYCTITVSWAGQNETLSLYVSNIYE